MTTVCPVCRTPFAGLSSRAVYCSVSCKSRAARARRGASRRERSRFAVLAELLGIEPKSAYITYGAVLREGVRGNGKENVYQ